MVYCIELYCNLCICVRIRISMYVYVYVYVCVYAHTCTYVSICTCMYIYINTYMLVHTNICTYGVLLVRTSRSIFARYQPCPIPSLQSPAIPSETIRQRIYTLLYPSTELGWCRVVEQREGTIYVHFVLADNQ